MTRILSLAMIKMEKNFVAYNDKHYSRKPHQEYPISNREERHNSLFGFVEREMEELKVALQILEAHKRTRAKGHDVPDNRMIIDQVYESMLEVGDVSNTLDYLFEGLLKAYHSLEEREAEG